MSLTPDLERILKTCQSAGLRLSDVTLLRKALEVRTVRITKREYEHTLRMRSYRAKPIGGGAKNAIQGDTT